MSLLIFCGVSSLSPTNNTGSSTQQGKSNGTSIFLTPGMSVEEFCKLFSPHFRKEKCKCPELGRICTLLKRSSSQTTFLKINCGKTTLPKAIIAVTLSTLGIIGNFAVAMFTMWNWKLSAFCHKLIGGLALSDLAFLLFTLIRHLPEFWTCQWYYGPSMCKFLNPAINMTATLGLGFVLIISVERYVGISHPFSRGMSSKTVYSIVALNFLVSLASVVPAGVVLDGNNGLCREVWPNKYNSKVYTWVLFGSSFAAPVLIISALYFSMLYQLRQSAIKCLQKMEVMGEPYRNKRKQENKRIAAIVLSLVVVFVLFVAPNRIYWILKDYEILDGYSLNIRDNIKMVCDLAYIFHSVLNPIIYSVVDAKFRASLKEFFLCGKARRRARGSSFYAGTRKRTNTSNYSCSSTNGETIKTEHL